ncbi:hypothetical protein [Dyadobacter sp. NIV53]|uniref:hypothetical protein n=1 Tax=Dyadobacter sp. NIV53 TaxID=2861765 RepID=UPI001C86D39B|nr:hypothetical protein [Dyadobacter sp. NIV53]
MAGNLKYYWRLEPLSYQINLEAGFSASIHDPVWFLGRQWQMGEHQGENASSPVWVKYVMNSHLIKAADSRFDPQETPAEFIVESELFDWWTTGRRVRIGKKLSAHAAVQGRADLLFKSPPAPYEHFINQLDGLATWKIRAELGIADEEFDANIPADSTPAWNSRELLYQQTTENAFQCNKNQLTVNRHKGGILDWYSVDATPANIETQTLPAEGEVIPTALQYPGAPNSRWWEIENANVDMGGYAPDSAHTPTAVLTDLIFSHSDDWFLFPVLARAGNVIAIDTLTITDVFGRSYDNTEVNAANELRWPGLQPPEEWKLFKVDGLEDKDLVLWHVAELPLESIPLERVQFGMDEQSNLMWAVERTVDGRDAGSAKNDTTDENSDRFNPGTPSGSTLPGEEAEYAYVPAIGIAPFWYPYKIDENEDAVVRNLVQQGLPDFSRQKPVAMPLPTAEVLQPEVPGTKHIINPLAIPSNGIELVRRWQLARDMNGKPINWIQRKREPLLSPPGRLLRFDVLEIARF